TLDTVAKGLDFDLTANPTKNWRLFASVGRQRTVFSNAGAKLAAWLDARLPVWQSYPSWTTALMPTGNLLIKDSFQTDVYNVYYYTLALKNGSLVDNQREWRANFTTNYRFTTGLLEGWTMGGGARYRTRARIGYPLMMVKASNGQTVSTPDFEHPYYTADEITWDAMLRYRFKLHGRMTWDLQLNVRNVFDANRVAGATTLSTGVGVRYFSQEPRTATLETSLGF
ncbi:MAG: hypothetical protein ABIQ12_11180, partial [Opitutaceae bacterium]